MNICFCISGQIRNPELIFPSLHRYFSTLESEGHNVYIIFSVWENIGRKIDGSINKDQIYRIFDVPTSLCIPKKWLGCSNLWSNLPNIYTSLISTKSTITKNEFYNFFPNAIIDIEDANFLDLEFEENYEDKNSLKMFYKIWRADRLRIKLEKSKSISFDYIIRMRPDTDITSFSFKNLPNLEKNEILTDYFIETHDKFICGDSFAIGNPNAMNVYSSFFSETFCRPKKWIHIHINLANYLLANDIKVTTFNPRIQLFKDTTLSIEKYKKFILSIYENSIDHEYSFKLTELLIDKNNYIKNITSLLKLSTDDYFKDNFLDNFFGIASLLFSYKKDIKNSFLLLLLNNDNDIIENLCLNYNYPLDIKLKFSDENLSYQFLEIFFKNNFNSNLIIENIKRISRYLSKENISLVFLSLLDFILKNNNPLIIDQFEEDIMPWFFDTYLEDINFYLLLSIIGNHEERKQILRLHYYDHSIIKICYLKILNRHPDPDGLKHYTNTLINSSNNYEKNLYLIIDELFSSTEYKSNNTIDKNYEKNIHHLKNKFKNILSNYTS